MTQQKVDLQSFINRVQAAADAPAVFSILKEFRALPFSDEDCARMSKAYVRVLDRVGAAGIAEDAAAEDEKPDGPVWYEKM